jgi:hypothetical protein
MAHPCHPGHHGGWLLSLPRKIQRENSEKRSLRNISVPKKCWGGISKEAKFLSNGRPGTAPYCRICIAKYVDQGRQLGLVWRTRKNQIRNWLKWMKILWIWRTHHEIGWNWRFYIRLKG